MWLKLAPFFAFAAILVVAAYFGGDYMATKAEVSKLQIEINWQEARYETLVRSARALQEKLEEQQRLTAEWQEKYDALASKAPEIRERVLVVTERVPEYIPAESDAERALWGLAMFSSTELQGMVDGSHE